MIFLRSSYIFRRIYNALAERQGKRVTLPTLATVTGLSEKQIQNSIANARRVSSVYADQIVVVKAGRAWKLKENGEVNRYPTPDEIVKEVAVGSTHIWKVVLKALVSNAGKITSSDLLAELASTPEKPITTTQARTAMLTIMRQPEIAPHIETKVAGLAWVYHTPQATAIAGPKTKSEDSKTVSAPIRGSVLRYFHQHPGETLFRDDIAEDLGFTVKQIQSAIWSLLNENPATKDDIVVVQPSYAWRYVPNRKTTIESNGHVTPAPETVPTQEFTPTPSAPVATVTLPLTKTDGTSVVIPVATKSRTEPRSRLFEEIGQTANGDILVQESESKKVYRAVEL